MPFYTDLDFINDIEIKAYINKFKNYRSYILNQLVTFEEYPKAVRTLQDAENTFIKFMIDYYIPEGEFEINSSCKYNYIAYINDIFRDELLPCLVTPPEVSGFIFNVSGLCYKFNGIVNKWVSLEKHNKSIKYLRAFIYFIAPVVLFFIETVINNEES